jgi:predicted nucleic acid-binding protein
MILYADTSALVKKYVVETGSSEVISFFEQYTVIGTATLTQVEMAAAMSKAVRRGLVEESETLTAWQDFLSHWLAYMRLPVSDGIVERASALAWRHGLRAYDSVHLASALNWQDAAGEETVFACFDKILLKAARNEGLHIWPEKPMPAK